MPILISGLVLASDGGGQNQQDIQDVLLESPAMETDFLAEILSQTAEIQKINSGDVLSEALAQPTARVGRDLWLIDTDAPVNSALQPDATIDPNL